jgi:hypothetical protein
MCLEIQITFVQLLKSYIRYKILENMATKSCLKSTTKAVLYILYFAMQEVPLQNLCLQQISLNNF